ncbi:MAG: ATP-binding cassette domain-containing protein [Candidatus Brocadiia bacterium]
MMIKAEELCKAFDGMEVLRGASLEVQEGEAVALIGASGGGKTVLLKHLVGLLRPDHGRVFVDGHDLCRIGGRKLQELRTRFGFLFQGGALFESMTIFDNVAFPLREKTDLTENEVHERAMRELDHVGLSGSEGKYPAQVSGGMIKRAALARALAQSPEIMLFDEPTTGLDPIIVHAIHELIESSYRRLGLTAIIVSHEIPNIFAIVDRVAMLHEGKVCFEGTPEEVMSCEDPVVRDFIRGSLPPEHLRVPELTALGHEEKKGEEK